MFSPGRGERDEAGVGIAGFRELGGLGDVLGGDEFGFEGLGELEAGNGGDGGSSVGGAIGIGNGQALETGVAQGCKGGVGPLRVVARPENERAASIGDGGLRSVWILSFAGIDQALGIAEVGRKKEVEGCSVGDLGGEARRRAW